MTTTTRTTARDEIRATADAHNWAVDATSGYHDRFIRGTELAADHPLARIYSVVDHAPCDLIVVHYDELGRVVDAVVAGPGQQSVITGCHSATIDLPRKGRRAAVLAALADGVRL